MTDENKQENKAGNSEIKDEDTTKVDDVANATDASENTDNKHVENKIPYDRFKAKVDEANALKKKLAEIEEAKEAQERKQLEEQNEYKTLYEKAQETIEQQKVDALNAKKSALLAQAGYDDKQIELLGSTVEGETDEELAKAVKDLKAVISPKKNYIDPSPMGGGDGKPKPKGNEGLGKTLYERVMGKK